MKNKKKHNSDGLKIPDHPHRILIVGHSGYEKIKALLNLTIKPSLTKYTYLKKVYVNQNFNH